MYDLVFYFFKCLVCFRNQSTHRGAIKKMKFAPGRGNVKLMLQLSDGVEIWDLGKVFLQSHQKGGKFSRQMQLALYLQQRDWLLVRNKRFDWSDHKLANHVGFHDIFLLYLVRTNEFTEDSA
jgi:hypothetical protein